MNKREFVRTLSKELNYSEDKCFIINDILENDFFISKNNQAKIITELMQRLNINSEEASSIYDTSIRIIKDEIKYKLKHPFKNQN